MTEVAIAQRGYPRQRVFCGLCGRLLRFGTAYHAGRFYCAEHARLIERGEHVPPDPATQLPTLADEAVAALVIDDGLGP